MEIRKETVITPMTTDGKVLKQDDKVVFNATGRCFTGIFKGISTKGALKFNGIIAGCEVEFNVMPKSIDCIYKADVLAECEVAE